MVAARLDHMDHRLVRARAQRERPYSVVCDSSQASPRIGAGRSVPISARYGVAIVSAISSRPIRRERPVFAPSALASAKVRRFAFEMMSSSVERVIAT